MAHHDKKSAPLSSLLRVDPEGVVDLAAIDPEGTPGFPGDRDDVEAATLTLEPELSDLQERLYAAGRSEPETAPSVLVVLQGMDTSGKGGVIRHSIGLIDPQGVSLKAFKAPTKEELSHHYLWRIRKALPQPGMIGIFDRSHYEDVLVVRVDDLVPALEWEQRYEEINRFEQELVDGGTTIIKCMLHIDSAEQKQRLLERLDDPGKHWKYNPGDVDSRLKWPAYQQAYTAVLDHCSTEAAPWFVIPSNRKWYRNWAVAELLREHLSGLALDWPSADFDVALEKQRVSAS